MSNLIDGSRQVLYTDHHQSRALQLEGASPGETGLRFQAAPGLYRFSVVVDASEFDWESLYVNLTKFHNQGQRTGPWDFNIDSGDNEPLMPSYWVALDGHRIGLWFFQRVSLEDLEHQRFRGNMSFHVAEEGAHTLTFTPYRAMTIRWWSAKLETDPEDRLAPRPAGIRPAESSAPFAAWTDPAYWAEQREKLSTSHSAYREPLEALFQELLAMDRNWAGQVPYLVAAAGLMDAPEAVDRAMEGLDEKIALPHWGNPKEDGYSHDGDFIAASVMLKLAWGLRMLEGRLGEERQQRLIDKLARQGEKFFELALLNADYWGGSVLQDHGWRSAFTFGTSCLYMLGLVPGAEKWLSYALPRVERGLAAMPLDGAVQPSSHCSFPLYVGEATHFRDTLLAMTGDDIFLRSRFHNVVDFLCRTLDDSGAEPGVKCCGRPLWGGNHFLNRMASLYQDGRAAWLQQQILEAAASLPREGAERGMRRDGAFWGFFSYDPDIEPVPQQHTRRTIAYFPDSGYARYHNDNHEIVLSLQCGPWCGHHAYRTATGSCDRIGQTPGSGHFVLALRGQERLVTPDGGYRLHSFLASCLLVDDRGQIGDLGYPMGLPSYIHPGDEIQSVQWDEETGLGRIRLDLRPAYPESADLAHYTRDFLVSPEEKIICRDHVVLNRPHRLSWLFQGTEKDGTCQEDGLRYRFGDDPPLRIEPSASGPELAASVCPTDVVWAYVSSNNFEPFIHLRYDSCQEISSALVDFALTW